MKAVVVYESVFGNTAQVAQAIAAGIGEDAVAVSTADIEPEDLATVDLVVAGGPVFAFHLSSDTVREGIATKPQLGAPEADLSHPSMRTWLDGVNRATGLCAAFDTQVRGPFGSGAPAIAKSLQARGLRLIASPQGFIVDGKYGPLRSGELERAQAWGAELRQLALAAMAADQ